ncbi:E3 ubiquitin-protein ligase Midline-1-like [Branchiostoma lanceolatum]|uniref:E3 ubiquitin-protein ligase Midline-1-like n=1 Tax=Branchiostoma lanceolatum TaxID=7740 RepID=UPI003452FCE7
MSSKSIESRRRSRSKSTSRKQSEHAEEECRPHTPDTRVALSTSQDFPEDLETVDPSDGSPDVDRFTPYHRDVLEKSVTLPEIDVNMDSLKQRVRRYREEKGRPMNGIHVKLPSVRKTCARHREDSLELALYCETCKECMCYKCALAAHKDHNVEPVSTAAKKKKERLLTRRNALSEMVEKSSQQLGAVEEKCREAKVRIESEILGLMSTIDRRQQMLFRRLDKDKQAKEEYIQEQMTLCGQEVGLIDRALCKEDSVEILEVVGSIETGLRSRLRQNPADLASFDHLKLDLSEQQRVAERITFSSCNGGLSLDQHMTRLKPMVPFKLDPKTASKKLRILNSGKQVEYREHIPEPVGSRRGLHTVIGNLPVTTGKHYWEVTVNRSLDYRIGICYKTADGAPAAAGEDKNSWVLCLGYPNRFTAMHYHKRVLVFSPFYRSRIDGIRKIGVHQDYDLGYLAFFSANSGERKLFLYAFHAQFEKPTYPLFYVGQGKLTIHTGLSVPKDLPTS